MVAGRWRSPAKTLNSDGRHLNHWEDYFFWSPAKSLGKMFFGRQLKHWENCFFGRQLKHWENFFFVNQPKHWEDDFFRSAKTLGSIFSFSARI